MAAALQLEVRGLLFDMDGTLVQSLGNVEEVWSEWAALHGIEPARVLAVCHGVRSGDVIAQVAPQLDVAEQLAELDAIEARRAPVAQEIDGARVLLSQLHGCPWAMATSAGRRTAVERLQTCGLPQPPVLVAAEDVQAGKPDPEPYRRAAQLLGIAPELCVAFEDAEAGMRSALAAGCRVVQIGDGPALHAQLSARVRDLHAVRVQPLSDHWQLLIDAI